MVKRKKLRKGKESLEKKMKDKNGEVAIARDRLAGALKGILNPIKDDNDEITSSYSQSSTASCKKLEIDNAQSCRKANEDHQSYVVKLFDRSVDLAQFNIDTPLYPICRSWIQNKPIGNRNKNDDFGLFEVKHEQDNDNGLYEFNEGTLSNILKRKERTNNTYRLPSPEPLPEGVQTLRIPSPGLREIQEINLEQYYGKTAPSREELLTSHLQNWTRIRRRWRMASHKNEERYAASKKILTNMFERAQVQFRMPIG